MYEEDEKFFDIVNIKGVTMSMEDMKAITTMQKKFYLYTKDGYKKAKNRTYICDKEIKHLLDYLHEGEEDYIGCTARFLYNEEAEMIVGFRIYELYKNKIYDIYNHYKIEDGIDISTIHEMGFAGGFHTIKIDNRFMITPCEKLSGSGVVKFVEL